MFSLVCVSIILFIKCLDTSSSPIINIFFIRHLLKPPGEKDIRADLPIVATGTQATVAASALQGAHIVRVHEVAETRATLKIIDAIRTAGAEPSGDAQGAG